METKVTFIIPARNEEKHIRKCVESILGQSYPNFTIIVINDGSTDKTKDILSQYRGVTVIEEKGIGPGAARNRAWPRVKSEFIAFCDADCYLDKDWLKNSMESFSSDVDVVGGKEYLPDDESEFGKMVYELFSIIGFTVEYINNQENVVEVSHLPSNNLVIRQSAMEELGGFNESLWTGEDVDLSIRARKSGFKMVQNPKAKIYNYRPQNLALFLKMMKMYGSAQRVLVKIYGITRKVQTIPFLIAAFIAVEIIIALISGLLPPLVILLVGIILAQLFFLFKTKGNGLKAASLFFIFVLSVVYWNIGFLSSLNNNDHRKISTAK